MNDSTRSPVEPVFRSPAPPPAAPEVAVETLVGRWQNAHQVHECNGCVEAIEVGEPYLRLVNIGAVETPEGVRLESLGSKVLWGLVARQRIAVEKYHESCWVYENTRNRRVLVRLTD